MVKKKWIAPTHRIIEDAREKKNVLSELTGSTVVTNLQQSTHLRSIKLSEFLRLKCIIPRLDSVKCNVSVRWQVCGHVNAKHRALTQEGFKIKEQQSGEVWGN